MVGRVVKEKIKDDKRTEDDTKQAKVVSNALCTIIFLFIIFMWTCRSQNNSILSPEALITQ